MEEPNATEFGEERFMQLVARTNNIEEAERVADTYRARGFETKIVRKEQGGIVLYEVWAGKKPEIFKAQKME